MPTSEKVLYRFDEFTIDPTKRALLRNGTPVSVSPKAFDILSYLAANSGRVVTKKELLSAVWPDSFVEESNLAQHVSWLRKAFGDRAAYIVTVPGRGFQFTATVRTENVSAQPPIAAVVPDAATTAMSPPDARTLTEALKETAGASASPATVAARPGSRALIATAVAVGIVIILGALFAYRRFTHAQVQPPPSVVVLPFENLTGDPNKEYLSDGVTEEVIDSLARAQGGRLKVIARTSSMSFKASSKTVREIAQELGVQYVLEGSVRSEGDRLHVAARLVRGDDQTYLWSDGADGDANQILAFETRLTNAVARSLSASSAPGAAPEHLPANDQAHQAYLQGLYFVAQRSKSGLESALQQFGTAVAEDPQYARAYAQLAVTYNLLGQFGWMDTGQAHNQARAAALQAIAADADLAEAHAALGFNDWFYEWNFDAAEKELSKAVALEPTNADARHWYALLLMTKRQPAEAEQQMRAALAIDPKALILRTNLGWLHYTNRQYPLAIDEMQAVVHDDPDFLTAHYKLWWAYSMAGDTPNAMHEVNEVARLVFKSQDQTQIAEAYDHGGYPAALEAMTRATHENPPYLLVDDARRIIFAGDTRASVAALQHALHEREGWMIVVASDPAFDALRSDPAYVALLAQLHATP